MRNATQSWATALTSNFWRHDLDVSDFVFDPQKHQGALVVMGKAAGAAYVKNINVSAMRHGDRFTVALGTLYDPVGIVGIWDGGNTLMTGFPTGALISGVITFICIDGVIYV